MTGYVLRDQRAYTKELLLSSHDVGTFFAGLATTDGLGGAFLSGTSHVAPLSTCPSCDSWVEMDRGHELREQVWSHGIRRGISHSCDDSVEARNSYTG